NGAHGFLRSRAPVRLRRAAGACKTPKKSAWRGLSPSRLTKRVTTNFAGPGGNFRRSSVDKNAAQGGSRTSPQLIHKTTCPRAPCEVGDSRCRVNGANGLTEPHRGAARDSLNQVFEVLESRRANLLARGLRRDRDRLLGERVDALALFGRRLLHHAE